MPSGAAAYTCPDLMKRWWSALEPALPLSALPRQTASVIWAEAVSAVGHLAERFLGVTDIFALSEMALRGNKAMADLRIADVQEEDVPGLAADLTAANFGRIKSGTSDADLAAALFNMIYENVGVMASLALSRDTTRNVVLTGSLASLAPAAKTFDIFNQMHDVFGIDYIIPPHPSFATAVGALLCDPLPEN